MKKIVPILASLFLVLCSAFGAVAVKDVGNGEVDVVFTMKDDSVSELAVIGSFNDWTEPGDAMAKNADGEWEYTLRTFADDEIQYKFFHSGNYIFDFRAPDKIDDGFGGNNGFIAVADILAAPPAATGGEAGSVPTKEYNSRVRLGMYTIMGPRVNFITQGIKDKTVKGLEVDRAEMYAKSYWKISGTLLPNVNTFFEMKIVDSAQPIWSQDPTGLVTDNKENWLGETLFNPLKYYGYDDSFCKLTFGIESPYVNWQTGIGYAQASKIDTGMWTTLDGKNANDGYMRFDLGPKLQNIGDAKITATLMPNKLNSEFGLLVATTVEYDAYTVALQYDLKSQESVDLTKMFAKAPYHQDIILAGKGVFGSLTVEANALANFFADNNGIDMTDRMAGEAKVSYSADIFGGSLGYRMTGSAVSMLHGDNGNLEKNKATGYVNPWVQPIDMLKIGADTSVTFEYADLDANKSIFAKPYADASFDLLGMSSNANVYSKLAYDTDGSAFNCNEVGARLYMSGMSDTLKTLEFMYGCDNNNDNRLFNTLITKLGLSNDINAEVGLGLRTMKKDAPEEEKKANNMLGFSLGGSWKIPSRALKTPLLYTAFVYNMDPYDDGTNGLKMSDYIIEDGVDNYDGKAQVRLMIKWDF
ncbi:MAG TPA: glycogen-binding domain-containing protein [Treponemataceae bacterium]|nr:glycogen-binding domain-containing protein [Treponemataceae bacterium]